MFLMISGLLTAFVFSSRRNGPRIFPSHDVPRYTSSRCKICFYSTKDCYNEQLFPDVQTADRRLKRAKELVLKLSSSKTWERLGPVCKFAMMNNTSSRTCVDIGCDHGLLTLALGNMAYFEKVLGVDISERALNDGALSNLEEIAPRMDTSSIEFRVSDGLKGLQQGESDTICISGMGINAMKSILFEESGGAEVKTANDFECHRIIVQPTNSRPRNLMVLYEKLQENDFVLVDENIQYISSRWYVTSLFEHNSDNNSRKILHPCEKQLMNARDTEDIFNTIEYIKFHKRWIEEESEIKPNLHVKDQVWRNMTEKYSIKFGY